MVGSWNPIDTLPVPRNVAAAPVINDFDETMSDISMRPPVESEGGSTINDDARSDDSLDEVPASSARDLRQIVVQLRNLNARLDDLEQTKKSTPAPVVVLPSNGSANAPTLNGTAGYHPPPAPFGVNKVTENALTSPAQPMGWMSRLAGSIDISSFVRGIGAGVFSTTTAATLAAILVYFFRKRGFSFFTK